MLIFFLYGLAYCPKPLFTHFHMENYLQDMFEMYFKWFLIYSLSSLMYTTVYYCKIKVKIMESPGIVSNASFSIVTDDRGHH